MNILSCRKVAVVGVQQITCEVKYIIEQNNYNEETYSVSQKKSPLGYMTFFHFYTNGCEFVIDFLHTY